ncbi:phosphoglycerate dehydrogenase [Cerasicoccus arenae]|uniref:D-3-phosphoglycerate dehydrogenase n=1 Tax=Cerasicoccus arenae TaxID=424488 RepID=A0A8J3GDK4_9BACT|nr:phosphoglycerate dehydrogenase [Cerasicoccus arenae]MBK1857082.1 phosphoglycerate dehydrogenase [Cerasicoccus arenae]GHB92263.1 D-3-phosphoglycerate dehydrogenase [Cerasicoccus arenae]
MKILVADKISPTGIEYFKQQPGYEVVVAWEVIADWSASPEQVISLIGDVDGIAVRSETTVSEEVIAAAPKLKVVGRAGVGVDNVNIPAATERGVIVMNTPGGNTIATAELTFTHMLCGSRPIARADAEMKAGGWPRKTLPKGAELYQKVLGVCGLGRIGAEVAKRAQGFGMTVLAYDPYLTESRAETLGLKKVDLDTLVKQSDYITVHMPLTPETKYMIDEAAIAKMKKGVRLFNCARGGIIKESALIEGLQSGKVAAAGLDVYEDEPLAKDCPFRSMDNVVLTPHLGASTSEAQESVGIEIAEQMVDALNGGMVRNAINMPSIDPKDLEKLKPYLNLGEKLGSFIQQLSNDGVEKIKISYFGKIINLDTTPLSRAIQRGYLARISPNVNDVNAPSKLEQLGVDVETTRSSTDANYTELIEVQAIESSGKTRTVAGTLFGKSQSPRIVSIDGHGVEVNTSGTLLVVKNKDVPGMVGYLGTVLGKDGVNIANLSLARDQGEGFAISVVELDSAPSAATQAEISGHEHIEKFKVIEL